MELPMFLLLWWPCHDLEPETMPITFLWTEFNTRM